MRMLNIANYQLSPTALFLFLPQPLRSHPSNSSFFFFGKFCRLWGHSLRSELTKIPKIRHIGRAILDAYVVVVLPAERIYLEWDGCQDARQILSEKKNNERDKIIEIECYAE